MSGGECRIGVEGTDSRAVVIVSWDSEHRRAHLEIGVPHQGSNRWRSRDLTFGEADPEPERWKAVGLVVGTLVGEAERERDSPSEASTSSGPTPANAPAATGTPASPAPKPATPSAAVEPQRPKTGRLPDSRAPRNWVGVEFAAGPALDDGSWRYGPGLVAVFELDIPMFVVATARYLARPEDSRDVEARWFVLSAGAGVSHDAGSGWRFEGTSEMVLDRMDASITTERFDQSGRWLPGARLGIGVAKRLDRWGAASLGLHATALTKGTVVTVGGEQVGRAPPLTLGISAGFRFGL